MFMTLHHTRTMCSLISLGSGPAPSDGSDCGGVLVGNAASEGNGSFSIGHMLPIARRPLYISLCNRQDETREFIHKKQNVSVSLLNYSFLAVRCFPVLLL